MLLAKLKKNCYIAAAVFLFCNSTNAGEVNSKYLLPLELSVNRFEQAPGLSGEIVSFDPRVPEDCEKIKHYLQEQPFDQMPAEKKLELEMEVCFQVNKNGFVIPESHQKTVFIHKITPNQKVQLEPRNQNSISNATVGLPDLGASAIEMKDRSSSELRRKTTYMWILGMLGMVGLAALPESVTKWNQDQRSFQNIQAKYRNNVIAGPVWDKDNWAFNYIGHPLSGAGYYTLARTTGKSIPDSFKYSLLMSTFYWEYGLEAVAEIPSIQDLVFTPGIGSIIGELLFRLVERVHQNNGKLLNSKVLGRFAILVMDPFGPIIERLDQMAKRIGIGSFEMFTKTTTQNYANGFAGTLAADQIEPALIMGIRLNFKK